MTNILWCITGAGHLLEESVNFMKKISREHKITVVFSGAGYEVTQMYGLLDSIKENFGAFITECGQGYSSPLVGRLTKEEYGLVVVSPCTANTVAKIVAGIADSLISNVVAQAVKAKMRVYVVPTDYMETQKTTLPLLVDPKICINCKICPPINCCSMNAIYRDEKIRINMLECNACKTCIDKCSYAAISFGKKVDIHPRDIDIENTKKLQTLAGIYVFENPEEIKI